MEYHASIEASQSGQYPQAAYQVSPYTDILTIYNKDRIPQDFPLMADSVTIGRTDANDITLNDKAISRSHAKLERNDDGWWISDLGSTNGVLFGKTRIAPNQPVRWSPDSKVNLGPFQLRWQRHLQEDPDDRTQIHLPSNFVEKNIEVSTNSTGVVESSTDIVELRIRADRRSVAAGESIYVNVNLLNMGTKVDDYQLFVEGIPQHWVDMPTDVVRLEPTREIDLQFTIFVPEGDQAVRGGYDFRVVLESLPEGRVVASDSGQFTIEELHDFELMVRQTERKDGAMCDVAVLNRGNAADFYSISAASSDGDLNFNARQWQLALTPSTQDHLRVMIRPNSQPLVGSPKKVPFVLTATSNSGIEKSYYGDVNVQPKLTPRKLGAICLAVIAISALVWFALQYLPSAEVAQSTAVAVEAFARNTETVSAFILHNLQQLSA